MEWIPIRKKKKEVISAYHDPIQRISVSKHPRVSEPLTGMFNKTSPQLKFNFIWDVKNVINFLSSQRFVTNGSWKHLILKLTMVLAGSAGRVLDIAYLYTRYLLKRSSEYIFQFGKTTKTLTRARQRKPMKFYPFRENANFCVCQSHWFVFG